MANRNNTFILKRSNVVGKIPPLSGLTLGEIALNTADAKLYTLYTAGLTGATEVREIGWDKLDTYVTGFTYSNNNLTINQNQGQSPLTVNVSTMTGLTINGNLTATTYYGLPIDVYTTGGTYSNSTGIASFTNNSGGTFTVSGFFKPSDDVYVTGGTYSNGTATFTNKAGGTFTVTGFTTPFTGGTVNGATIFTGDLSANIISATTYNNLPLEFTINGNSAVIQTSITGTKVMSGSKTFTKWAIRGWANNDGTGSGSIVLTLTKNGTSMIGAGNAPTLTSSQSNSATISGWTSTSVIEGDTLVLGVSSVTSLIGSTVILY